MAEFFVRRPIVAMVMIAGPIMIVLAKPQQAMVRGIGTSMFVMVILVSNEQTYNFLYVVNFGLMFVLALIAVWVSTWLPISFEPAQVIFKQLRRFLASAGAHCWGCSSSKSADPVPYEMGNAYDNKGDFVKALQEAAGDLRTLDKFNAFTVSASKDNVAAFSASGEAEAGSAGEQPAEG